MNLIKVVKWSAAHVAWLSMAWSPVALGAEAEKLSTQKLTQYIQEFGLNKKTTVGEFWEKSKAYYPGYVYKEIEAFVQQNKNLQMPEVIVSAVKTTDGTDVPTLQLSSNGRVQSIQIFSEKQKWAKFNNTILSSSDMQRPYDIFKRVQANDIRIQRDAEVLQKKYQVGDALRLKNQSIQQKDLARFDGFPRMTPQLWKTMTPVHRASFFVNMRLMWRDAQKVLDSAQITGYRRDQKQSTVHFILEKLIKNEAFALDPESVLAAPPRTSSSGASGVLSSTSTNLTNAVSTNKGKPRVYDANSCIVAGYVGVYDRVDNNRGKNRQGCSVEKAIDEYKARESLGDLGTSIKQANSQCSSSNPNFIACNPIIYGYPNGKPACVNKEDPSFQTATHYQGACDAKSPLMSTNEPLFKDKDYSNIMPREKQIAMIEADQNKQNNELTKQFLKGVLSSKDDKSLFNAFQNGEWSKELDNELVRIQNSFEEEINGAIKTCESDTKQKNEVNQKGACDQLHRRWLFTEKFLIPLRQKACVPGTHFIGSVQKPDQLDKKPLLCECENDTATKLPLGKEGGKCPTKTTSAKEATVVEKSCPSGTSLLQGGDENKCVCLNNKDKQLPQSTSPDKVGELCEEKSNAWKWVLGGLGVLALLALFNRHKKSQPATPPNPPPLCDANKKLDGGACICAVSCPVGSSQNPGTCGCETVPIVIPPQLCPAPKIGMPPNCECPVSNTCASGQQIYNHMSCQCDNVPQPVVCPDGKTARDGNLASCDRCANGSYVPMGGCPSSNEGGKGNNCPSGKCSGGVPTTH